ncbi:MAG: universal stress protein [Bacteroidales bacterium]|jgi:nucleotide-binding universal stress UspA family protein|nr:universal stress protein [Bacteroidales bacterium]
MKKILVAIDFLDCSINALAHAVSIAARAKAEIEMVWVNMPDQSKDIFKCDPETLLLEVQKRFKELIEDFSPELEGGKMSYQIREGKVYKEIVNAADEGKADMIVAGTHGSSGFEEFWIGSNANKIVSASNKPIITIRGGIDIKRPLSKIVLPLDSTIETRQKLPFTTELAKINDAVIHILAVYTTKVEAVRYRVDTYTDQVIEYLEEEGVKYVREAVEADNLTKSTIGYAERIDANLISIMTEQERTTANLWLGPYAQQMVNHSPFPVLSIHPKELIRSLSR